MELFLIFLYTLIFSIIIYYSRFFKNIELPVKIIIAIFLIKIISGILLNYIYARYYTDKETSDIYKYFYDSKPIYDAFLKNPLHFFQLIFGINDNADYLRLYTDKTINWHNSTSEYLKYINTEHNFFNSHRLITKFNAVVRIFSFGYLSIHVVFMCFLSLIGQVYLFKTFYSFFKNKKYELTISIFLIPSVLLWSSGVLKEGVLIFGLGLFIYSIFKIINKFSFRILILLIFALLIICITKYYVLVALVPALISYIIVYYSNNKNIILKYLFVLSAFIILFSVIGYISPKYNCINILADKQSDLIRNSKGGSFYVKFMNGQEDFIYIPPEIKVKEKIIDTNKRFLKLTAGIPYYLNNESNNKLYYTENDDSYYCLVYTSQRSGSYFEIPKIENNFFSVLKNIPVALFNVLFRPFIYHSNSLLILFSAIENILMLLFAILCIVFRKKQLKDLNLLLFCITFVFISYILIGLTTPVSGAIVRYKIVALPFFMMIFLIILDKDKIHTVFRKILNPI